MSYLRFASNTVASLQAQVIMVANPDGLRAIENTSEVLDVVEKVLYTRELELDIAGLAQLAVRLGDRRDEHQKLRRAALRAGDHEVASVHFEYGLECARILDVHCTPQVAYARAM